MPFEAFLEALRRAAEAQPWWPAASPERYTAVARLMQSRTKLCADVAGWAYFFGEIPVYDDKAVRKFLARPGIPEALEDLAQSLAGADFATPAVIEAVVAAVTARCGIEPGRLNQPIRVAVTGCTIGAGVYETLCVLGRETVLKRLRHAVGLARAAGTSP
jgi:glutamyl-tRNA synthetase